MSASTSDETKPILHDSGIHIKTPPLAQYQQPTNSQQHFIIQPIEFDHKHRNIYGYLALGAFILVLINYIMIKERSCQISIANGYQNYDLIQSFHMTTIIVAIVVFVLSYFNFALVIYDVKPLFYASAVLIFLCSFLLIYDTIAIVTIPCVPLGVPFGGPVLQLLDASIWQTGGHDIFTARDGVGITVFFFDLTAAILMFFAGQRFYKRN